MKITWGDVAVVVSDTAAAKTWWTKTLGFDLRDDMGHWVTVAPKGSSGVVLHLCQNGDKESGNTGIGFYVDDCAAIEKAWTAKGVKFTRSTKQGAASVSAMFADPDGNEYWLFEDDDLKVKPKAAAKPKKKAAAKKAPKKLRAGTRRVRR
jgi:predicted enzyme related to lactoylglutathione lyase